MFIAFVMELRRRKVPVGLQEVMSLAEALTKGLHNSSLEGFYDVARALLIHSERHLDTFDEAFAVTFRGAQDAGVAITEELLNWLRDAQARQKELSEAERALFEQFSREEIEKLFQQRLLEQKERHDGGNKWIGTGGTSPFGHSGAARPGIRVGGPGGSRNAFAVAQARAFREYRDDMTLDVRQLSVALRKLRAFAREGAKEELDLEQTIAETAKNAGELEVCTRPPRRANTRVILMMDVGGSMDPYSLMVSRLFSAASKATHFRELRTYYFHNCIHGQIYRNASLKEGISVETLMHECGKNYKLIVVGDALMAPYELMERTNIQGYYDAQGMESLGWMMKLAEHFSSNVWLNPEPVAGWYAHTISVLRRVFPMFPLTVEGLGEAVAHLTKAPVVPNSV